MTSTYVGRTFDVVVVVVYVVVYVVVSRVTCLCWLLWIHFYVPVHPTVFRTQEYNQQIENKRGAKSNSKANTRVVEHDNLITRGHDDWLMSQNYYNGIHYNIWRSWLMCVHSEPFHLCSKLTMVHTCSSAFGVGLDTVVPNIRTFWDV